MVIELIVLLILICFSGFFSMAETALTAVSNLQIAHFVELKKPGARALRQLREKPAQLLTTILIGNNLVNISASVLATTLITGYFEGIGQKEAGLVIGLVIGFMTLLILVFGEITPKTVAIKRAETIALWFAPIMLMLNWVFSPLARVLTLFSRPFVFLFGGQISEQGPFVTEESIKTLLFVGEKEGVIEKDEREMISSIFKFGDLTAAEVMTPRDQIKFIVSGANISQAIRQIKASGHSRLPVVEQNINNIIGVIFAKDLLEAPADGKVNEYLRQALFVPAQKKVGELLDEMQAAYKHLAIIVDEFGQTLGLVTLEDLVEEIVGEIHDEYERRK